MGLVCPGRCAGRRDHHRGRLGAAPGIRRVSPYLKHLSVIRKGQKKISTKRHEGPRRATKGLEKAQEGFRQRSGRGNRIPRRALKYLLRGQKINPAKGHEGVGKDSKGVREGPRRKTLREKSYPPRSRSHAKVTKLFSRRWVSASSMSRSLINIDGQDKQDGLLMVWAACSGTRVFTPLSSTITFSSTRIPKTRSQATGSLQTRTRSSSQSASGATASRPVYPVYPVHRCSLLQQTGLTGHGPFGAACG